MKEWRPPYIETKVSPVTVLEGDKRMKRLDVSISDEMIPYFKEVESGRVVYHYDVQKMLDEILICTFKIDHPEIKEIMTREGFEVES